MLVLTGINPLTVVRVLFRIGRFAHQQQQQQQQALFA